jgi:chromosome transmission fidelity protein 1
MAVKNLKLYETQERLIRDARNIIEQEGVGIFSSPTGTGKTLSLLLSVMDFLGTDDGGLTLENQLLEQLLLGAGRRTAVFYCARTHSQLSQVISELRRLGRASNAVILGSRKIYCINKEIRRDTLSINERCRDAVMDGCCEFYGNHEALDASGIMDIEDMVSRGLRQKACPYYASRKYAQRCEIVLLPYQLLFTKEGRRSAGVDVRGSVVIVDEAHNIYDAVVQMNSVTVSSDVVSRCIGAMKLYRERCRVCSTEDMDMVLEILERTARFRSSYSSDAERSMGVTEFLVKARLEDFNMLEVEDYLVESGIARRESPGGSLDHQLHQVAKFLSLLVMSDRSGRILHSNTKLTFTPMDPSLYFESILDCRALILAGGTMEPIDPLLSVLRTRRPQYFSYGSVCDRFLPLVLKTGPSGEDLVINYETREDHRLIKEVVTAIVNCSNAVKAGGVVCFLPSRSCLGIFRDRCGTVLGKKRVFYEDEATFEEYADAVGREPCVLFAVMGGRLSEGINFSDGLCRLLMVIGVPYPMQSVELEERVKYNGREYPTLVAMKAVNQALGRAVRHKDDYAAMVLLDKRYTQLVKYISPWIRERVEACDFRTAFSKVARFLSSSRHPSG